MPRLTFDDPKRGETEMKVDLHVHSRFSKRPSQWILKKIGCPESFTEPLQLYQIAQKRGMTHVTIADHNSISGALEIAHLPNAFMSEEITTYFPEDKCKLHILAADITEEQHQDIQRFRQNIYDLVAYLNQEEIFHVLAHPLYSINDRLKLTHIEQCLVLFRVFELNGARNERENAHLEGVLDALTPDHIERLAERYRLTPMYPDPWKKYLIGGSDDHSSLNIARTYTEIRNADDIQAGFERILKGDGRVIQKPSAPETLAHNLYGIAYQFYKSKFNLERYVQKDLLMKFLDRSLRAGEASEPGLISRLYFFWHHRRRSKPATAVPETLMGLLGHETRNLIQDHPGFAAIVENGGEVPEHPEQVWFDFVKQASNCVMLQFADHLMDHLSGGNVFNIFHTIGSAGGVYTMLAPYFIAYSLFSQDRELSHQLLRKYTRDDPSSREPVKVAHFTDTFYEVNGVALTLQQQVRIAHRNQKHLTIITCNAENRSRQEGIQNFKPIGVYELPEYPEQKVFLPPLLDMLQYCYENQFNTIHSATPGPIGLAALAIARILRRPLCGTYHTAIPQYARFLTGDDAIEDLTWKYILWYYDQMDFIYAPSRATKEELVHKGLDEAKIRVYPRGIDVERFRPGKRNGFLEKKYGVREAIKLIYVGRVSKEKNLHILEQAFKTLIQTQKDVHLVVVGDGPYLDQMKRAMAGTPCTFTGYLSGDDLCTAYASSDIFVFPSATDTFGNVVLEAQASGLPVIVSDQGGPVENMLPGKTGLVVRAHDTESLIQALRSLVHDRAMRRQMSRNARAYMEDRSFDNAFLRSWQMHRSSADDPQTMLARAV